MACSWWTLGVPFSPWSSFLWYDFKVWAGTRRPRFYCCVHFMQFSGIFGMRGMFVFQGCLTALAFLMALCFVISREFLLPISNDVGHPRWIYQSLWLVFLFLFIFFMTMSSPLPLLLSKKKKKWMMNPKSFFLDSVINRNCIA